MNIIFKNLMDCCLAGVGFFCLGYGFAYGDGTTESDSNRFIGTTNFFLQNTEEYVYCFFHFSFAATAATIDGGAVAERFDFYCYLVLSLFTTGVIYPVVTHWQ